MQLIKSSDYWSEQTLDDLFVAASHRFPDKSALVADRVDMGTLRLSYLELSDRVARAAAALHKLGVGCGDVVSIQLPNWWEFAVAALACGRLGAVVNPLIPNFRARELSYMLAFCEARVFIVPKLFRGFDHELMATQLKPQLPHLQHIIVVDGKGENGFDHALLDGSARIEPPKSDHDHPGKAKALALLMFTSGSTGAPKCVMHNNYSLVASINAFASGLNLGADDTLLACSPLGHMTSYLAVLMQSLTMGATAVLQDVWQAQRGVALMSAEGVTHTAASAVFLTDICDAVASGSVRPSTLRTFLCAGAPIAPVLIQRAARELDLPVSSQWGMSEALAATLTEPARAAEKSAATDGQPFAGMQAIVVDTQGMSLPNGETGRLLVRGPRMFMGYFKRSNEGLFDDDGWFDTGDLAFMDDEGYIRINGRTNDILIRGGENIPVLEIESILYQHPAVALAAIVGFPDSRLGERACAFVVLRLGESLDLSDVQAWMLKHQVAKQYWPERVAVIENMPTTASGKIQKFALRDRAKVFAHISPSDTDGLIPQ